MPRPNCGQHHPGETTSTTSIVVGTVGTVLSVAGSIAAVAKGVAAGSAGYPLLVAVAVAVAIIVTVIVFTVERCDQNPAGGVPSCTAGVIENIIPAFTGSTTDSVFPFTSQHDRVDVVVKQDYWDIIDANSDYVFCSTKDNSPIMPCFYYNPAVCNAGIGATVGATVGAVAGLLIAAAAVAAIGCATWILCLLALIVAIILVAAAAILGAISGGDIGKAATNQPSPSSTGTPLIPSQPLGVGDYVSTKGNLLKNGDLNNALSFIYVQTTTLHGHSLLSPSYSHTDPDANLQPDACQISPPIP